MGGKKVKTNQRFEFQRMNYYQITSGIEEEESEEETDSPWLTSTRQDELPSAVSSCLSPATVEDIRRELSRNSSLDSSLEDNNNKTPLTPVTPVTESSTGGVLMRRKSSGRSYGHRASQRFSRLLEGVTSLTSLVTGGRAEDSQLEGREEEEETAGPASLPYWVEASHNIYKVSPVARWPKPKKPLAFRSLR